MLYNIPFISLLMDMCPGACVQKFLLGILPSSLISIILFQVTISCQNYGFCLTGLLSSDFNSFMAPTSPLLLYDSAILITDSYEYCHFIMQCCIYCSFFLKCTFPTLSTCLMSPYTLLETQIIHSSSNLFCHLDLIPPSSVLPLYPVHICIVLLFSP